MDLGWTSPGTVHTLALRVTETLAYDAWGKRRPPSNWITPGAGTFLHTQWLRRGLTAHEHIDHVGLIHMGGRVYDYGYPRLSTVGAHSPSLGASHHEQRLVLRVPFDLRDQIPRHRARQQPV